MSKTKPKTPEFRKAEFIDMAKSFVIPNISTIATELEALGFFKDPASCTFHGSYPGGLYDHSRLVTLYLSQFSAVGATTFENPRSPFIIGMLHDLCKAGTYDFNPELCNSYSKRRDSELLGDHGDRSVMMASSLLTLTQEEVYCIRYHMGAYNQKDISVLGLAIKKFPNVAFTQTADLLASQYDGV